MSFEISLYGEREEGLSNDYSTNTFVVSNTNQRQRRLEQNQARGEQSQVDRVDKLNNLTL
jgi:hypothetical protein